MSMILPKEGCLKDMIYYKTIAGQSFPMGSIGKSDLRFRIQNTTEEECREYALSLEQSGYRKHTEKQISAGSKYPYNINLYYEYQNDKNNIFIFWDSAIHTVFITVEPLSALPTRERVSKNEACGLPTFTQLQLQRSGMCYIVQLESGEFIVVDGGKYEEKACLRLYEFLKENSLNGLPCVALWIFTHSHDDHISLATKFLNEYKDKVTIKAFAYQFPDCDKIEVAMESLSEMKGEIADFEQAIEKCYPNATIYTLHTGQSYFYDGVEIEVLYSLDDTYPHAYLSFNDTSSALRMKFKNEKTVLLLGDCMNEACKKMAHTYGDYLKSDILQVSHHGLIGGDRGAYELIDPEICFWPVAEERFLGKTPNQRYQWCLGEGGCDYNAYLRDDSIRKRTHYHQGVTTTIKL